MQGSSGTSTPKHVERDQPIKLFEQDYRELAQALGAPELAGSALDETAEAQPSRRAERASGDSNIPEPRSLFVQAEASPRSRWRRLAATVIVLAVGSAIAVGAYLHLGDRAWLDVIAPAATPSGSRVDASPEPKIAKELAAAPEGVSAPETRSDPEVRAEPPAATKAEPAPGDAPARSCPAAVEAMALCERLAHPTD